MREEQIQRLAESNTACFIMNVTILKLYISANTNPK